jgi:protein-arginine kinase activator protein McsA
MTYRRTILITNIWLSHFAGSEVVVRDLALGLLRRGHRPIVYSPTLGSVADDIARHGVSVIDDLRQLGEAPDIIHAHHSIPCGEALIRFPDVPAIYVCHAFSVWIEAPVHFPQIGVYVAVDEACRDRLVHTEGIDPQRVLIFHNAVDLARIPPRPATLSERPLRAVAFGKAAAVPEARIACEQLGIQFDAIGSAAGFVTSVPEQKLVQYDLVFASARAALEALCCGCAVIVCDTRGFAGLVTSQNFESLRAMNFGLRSLNEPLTVDLCVRDIGRYDPHDASRVAERARNDADLNKLLDKYEQLYNDVLAGERRPVITADARERAVARFLHENLPRLPVDTRWPWLAERESLLQEIETSTHKANVLTERLTNVQHQSAVALREHDGTTAAFRDQIETLQQQIATTTRECDETAAALRDQIEALQQQTATTTRECDETAAALRDQIEALQQQNATTTRERDETTAALRDRIDALQLQNATTTRERDETTAALRDRIEALLQQNAKTTRERDDAADQALTQQAHLNKSRLLKIGRLLRRITGRPIPY